MGQLPFPSLPSPELVFLEAYLARDLLTYPLELDTALWLGFHVMLKFFKIYANARRLKNLTFKLIFTVDACYIEA